MNEPRLKSKYKEETGPALTEEFEYTSPAQIPVIEKIVVSTGVGEATDNRKVLDSAVQELATVTGQKPVMRRARKSVANFKLRQGQLIGCTVTLRGDRMWEFFYYAQ